MIDDVIDPGLQSVGGGIADVSHQDDLGPGGSGRDHLHVLGVLTLAIREAGVGTAMQGGESAGG